MQKNKGDLNMIMTWDCRLQWQHLWDTPLGLVLPQLWQQRVLSQGRQQVPSPGCWWLLQKQLLHSQYELQQLHRRSWWMHCQDHILLFSDSKRSCCRDDPKRVLKRRSAWNTPERDTRNSKTKTRPRQQKITDLGPIRAAMWECHREMFTNSAGTGRCFRAA
jgi:hypothetical protein